ncbi:MAG: transcription antitermination factor NusB [Desulforegulaceae bacterium]|nr:transcription antitermination factor NusB [Desulforegulaceae bacterium]
MGYRRKARELALQALFYMDIRNSFSNESLMLFKKYLSSGESEFLNLLTEGVVENKEDIDRVIEKHSSNWRLHRMSCVDRNILRFAVYELCYCFDIPHKVSINEAIDIGKKFGTRESGGFINGLLDSIRKTLEKNERQS